MRFDRVIKLLLVCIPTTRSNSSATSSSVLAVKQSAPKSVYIHIPFCKRRCFYCDFPIQVVGNRKSTVETVSEEYVNYLLKEMQFVASNFKDSRVMLETIYFGGGTPSLLPDNRKLMCLYIA